MNLLDLTDESLLAYYESIRRQVMADHRLGGRYRLVGTAAKQYAERIRDEMNRRQMSYEPIQWPVP
jgi:hypothetical protein